MHIAFTILKQIKNNKNNQNIGPRECYAAIASQLLLPEHCSHPTLQTAYHTNTNVQN